MFAENDILKKYTASSPVQMPKVQRNRLAAQQKPDKSPSEKGSSSSSSKQQHTPLLFESIDESLMTLDEESVRSIYK